MTGPNAPTGASYLFIDSKGGLWMIGTEDGRGIRYFDGTRFFAPLAERFPKLQGSGFAEDREGGIWIASDEGIFRYKSTQVTKVVDGAAASSGIVTVGPDVLLTVMAGAADGTQTNDRLVRISRVNSQWIAETVLDRITISRLQLDQNGHILFGCQGGYCEMNGDEIAHWHKGEPLPIIRHPVVTRTDYAKAGSVVWRDRFGCVWMRSPVDASYQCPQDERPQLLAPSIVSVGTPQVMEMPDGSVALPSYSKIAIGRPGNFRVVTVANGYPATAFAAVASDGGIWISNENGLFVFPTHNFMEFWSERDGLGGNTWSILPQPGKILAAAGDAIQILDTNRSRWQQWLPLPAARQLEPGPANSILAASRSEGVWQVSEQGSVMAKSQPIEITTITNGPDNEFWAAGNDIFTLAFRGDRLLLSPQDTHTVTGPVLSLKFDRSGGLWACSDFGLLHRTGDSWHLFTTKDGLSHLQCRSIAIDQQQDIWYSYPKFSALSLIRNPASATPRFQLLQTNDAAYANFLDSDRRGWLWRGTPAGLFVADLQQAEHGIWLHLDRVDGLPAIDTNQNSFREDADGSVWFGADNSVIHLLPSDDFVHPRTAPSVFISAFSLNGGPAQMLADTAEFQNRSDVFAHIGSLQTDRRNGLHVRYRVLPEQATWQDSGSLDLHLGKLHWGSHTLQVQGALGDGPWSPISASALTVLKPFWLSWPVLLGFMLIVGASAVTALQRRRKRAQRAGKEFPDLRELRLAALSPEIHAIEGGVLDSRFEIGRILERGGFGTVAEGRDLAEKGRRCAVKIFHQEYADKDWLTKRFRHEVQALEQIRHPNVVCIYGHGVTPTGAPYLVMEFISGGTLRNVLNRGRVPREVTARYLRQIGDALREIHLHGVCHRDLKPENIMVREQAAPGEEIVLIDFSIALVKDPDETVHGLSRAAGTIYYMAPEQGIGYADESSDIYSLAKVLIEMLSGERLSTLLPEASIDLSARVRELLAAPSFGLSSESIQLIAQALEYHPHRRRSDVRAFATVIARDLESYTATRGSQESPRM